MSSQKEIDENKTVQTNQISDSGKTQIIVIVIIILIIVICGIAYNVWFVSQQFSLAKQGLSSGSTAGAIIGSTPLALTGIASIASMLSRRR